LRVIQSRRFFARRHMTDGKIDLTFSFANKEPRMAATRSDRKSRRTVIPDRWDLTDLVKDPRRHLDAHLSTMEAQLTQVESASATLNPALAGNDFASILHLSESVAQSASRLGAYAYLWF